MSDSGMHSHAQVDRDLGVTSLDGAHSHAFRLPDGTVVTSSEDGGHAHSVHDGRGRDGSVAFAEGGVHAHVVVVDGVELRTEVDGWHMHEVGAESVAEGGMHSHALVLPTGETVISQYAATSKDGKPRKKGSERKREKPTEKRLESVENAALAVLKDLKSKGKMKPKGYKPGKPKAKGEPAKKSRLDNVEDLSPPRGSVIPKYDPLTRKFVR